MAAATLILGVGNLLLSDEVVGVHIARRLQSMTLPPEIEVIDGGTEGYELIRFCGSRKRVIIVDCLMARDTPGTVVRADPDQLGLQWAPPYSSHQSGARELLQALGCLPHPPQVVVIGIVPESAGVFGTELSKAVSASMDKIVMSILEASS